MSHDENIIEIENISFGYENELVLKDISFNVHRGDYLGLIGPNGGGKTTLLKIILGVLKPQTGSVKFYGQEISKFKDWSKIGYVPQHVVKFDSNFPATVSEIVAMGLYASKGLFKNLNAEDWKRVDEVLDLVEMLEYKDKLISNLSGGQQQRVFIARALVSNPEILCLDEPTTGIDVEAQGNFYKLLHNLNSKHNLTLILVSHDVEVLAHEATEFACVNQTLVYHGLTEGFMKNDLSELYGSHLKLIQHSH